MIKQTIKQIEKQPLTWLALGASVIAGAVIAHRLSQSQPDRSALSESLDRQLHHARELGSHLWHDGKELAHSAHEHAGDWRNRSSNGRSSSGDDTVQQLLSNHDSALAAFLATLLAKGTASFFNWRSMEKARRRRHAATLADAAPNHEELQDLTVAELRKQAAELDISGRSSMNKEELINALSVATDD